jgi:starvation-inducible DNA-binding protein
MLVELRNGNLQLAGRLREPHDRREKHDNIATVSPTEVWIDETERRV